MTDFLESVRPVGPTAPGGSVTQGEVIDHAERPSVRQLLAELARLEDVVRAVGTSSSVDDPDVLVALAREQEIIDELHRRNP